MPLTPCSACGREISTEAGSCPQCGHPQTANQPASRGKCYSCAAPSSTWCELCGAPSCDEHLQGIHVGFGKEKRYVLRCQSCYSDAKANEAAAKDKWSPLWLGILGIFVIGAIILSAGLQAGCFVR